MINADSACWRSVTASVGMALASVGHAGIGTDMELEQMHQLEAVERCGTISAAAEELHMSQPSLSRSIQKLEKELGVELFERSRNRVVLNDAGRLALEHAHRLLRAERSMLDDFRALSRRQRILRIASVAPAPLWRLTMTVVEGFPGTILDPETVNAREVERRLLNRQADLAVTLVPIELPIVRCMPMMNENLFAYLPEGHPLAGRESVSFEDLGGEDFLVDGSAGFWIDLCRARMPHARILVQRDRTVLSQLLRTTDAIGFVTDASQPVEQRMDRVRVPISNAEAHATFHLSALADAPEHVLGILESATAEEPR